MFKISILLPSRNTICYRIIMSVEKYLEPAEKKEKVEGLLENQRESLVILASLGATKEYLGQKLTLGVIKKLPCKQVEKILSPLSRSRTQNPDQKTGT